MTDQGPPNIPGFQITGKLGEGGMGAVWAAVQQGTNRKVAIKTVTAGNLSDLARQRFALEIEVTAHLDHPNIGRLYESRIDAGQCFYAMEFIDGRDLEIYLEEDKPSVKHFVHVMLDVCKAVQYAHQKAIIHRDLKPGNVMMTTENVPKVVDFGLAKLVEDEKPKAEEKITGEGMAVGTPAYMSPEQIKASDGLIDTRTDVFALGVMLYEYVVGRHPHQSALDAGTMQLFMSVVQKTAPMPRSIKKSIDKDLEAVIMKAIATDPADRYPMAGDLAEDIERYLTGEPVLAQPQTTLYLLRKKIAKNRGKVALATAIFMSFVAFAVASVALIIDESNEAKRARAAAEVERDKAEERFKLGSSFAYKLITELETNLKKGPTAGRAFVVKSGKDYLIKLKKDVGDRPDLLVGIANVYNKIGEVQRVQGETEGAMESYTEAMKLFKELAKIDPENIDIYKYEQAKTYYLMARVEEKLGNLDKTEKSYKRGVKILKGLIKKKSKDVQQQEDLLVKIYMDHGKIEGRKGNIEGQADKYSLALDIRKQRYKSNPKDGKTISALASTYARLGHLRLDQGKPAAALKRYKKSLSFREKLVTLEPDNVSYKEKLAYGFQYIGFALIEQGKLARAVKEFESAREVIELQSNNDPTNQKLKTSLTWIYYFLVSTHIDLEQFEVASEVLKVAVPMVSDQAKADEKNEGVARMFSRLLILRGITQSNSNYLKKARKSLKKAVKIIKPLVKDDSKELYAMEVYSKALMVLGEVDMMDKKVTSAETYTFQGLDLLRKINKKSPDDKAYQKLLGTALTDAAFVLTALKEKGAAEEHFIESEEILRKLLKIDDTNAGARVGLVHTLIGRGDLLLGGKKKLKDGKAKTNVCRVYDAAQKEIRKLAAADNMLPSIRAQNKRLAKRNIDKLCK